MLWLFVVERTLPSKPKRAQSLCDLGGGRGECCYDNGPRVSLQARTKHFRQIRFVEEVNCWPSFPAASVSLRQFLDAVAERALCKLESWKSIYRRAPASADNGHTSVTDFAALHSPKTC